MAQIIKEYENGEELIKEIKKVKIDYMKPDGTKIRIGNYSQKHSGVINCIITGLIDHSHGLVFVDDLYIVGHYGASNTYRLEDNKYLLI